jgi:hypothetical protein
VLQTGSQASKEFNYNLLFRIRVITRHFSTWRALTKGKAGTIKL